VFPGTGGRVKGRAERGRLGDAVGALEAADGTRMIERPGLARAPGERVGGVVASLMLDRVVAASMVSGCGREAARLTYGPQADCVWPGDRMMDGLTPRPRRARPLSLIRPAAAPQTPAGTRSDKCVPGAGRLR
jgi:hypothetical protein